MSSDLIHFQVTCQVVSEPRPVGRAASAGELHLRGGEPRDRVPQRSAQASARRHRHRGQRPALLRGRLLGGRHVVAEQRAPRAVSASLLGSRISRRDRSAPSTWYVPGIGKNAPRLPESPSTARAARAAREHGFLRLRPPSRPRPRSPSQRGRPTQAGPRSRADSAARPVPASAPRPRSAARPGRTRAPRGNSAGCVASPRAPAPTPPADPRPPALPLATRPAALLSPVLPRRLGRPSCPMEPLAALRRASAPPEPPARAPPARPVAPPAGPPSGPAAWARSRG